MTRKETHCGIVSIVARQDSVAIWLRKSRCDTMSPLLSHPYSIVSNNKKCCCLQHMNMYSVLEYLNVQHPFFIYLGINWMKCICNRNEWMISTMLHAWYHLFVTHSICFSPTPCIIIIIIHFHSQSVTKSYIPFKLLLPSV